MEMRALALIAKGEPYHEIVSMLKEEFGESATIGTLTNIKKRYAEVLHQLKNTIIEYEEETAQALLEKSRKLLGKRLAIANTELAEYYKSLEEFESGEITFSEFKLRVAHFKLPTLTELTSVTKEMHAQSSGGGEGSLPPARKSDLTEAINDAIARGDTVALERIVFNADGSEPADEPPRLVQPSGKEPHKSKGDIQEAGLQPVPGTDDGTPAETEAE